MTTANLIRWRPLVDDPRESRNGIIGRPQASKPLGNGHQSDSGIVAGTGRPCGCLLSSVYGSDRRRVLVHHTMNEGELVDHGRAQPERVARVVAHAEAQAVEGNRQRHPPSDERLKPGRSVRIARRFYRKGVVVRMARLQSQPVGPGRLQRVDHVQIVAPVLSPVLPRATTSKVVGTNPSRLAQWVQATPSKWAT